MFCFFCSLLIGLKLLEKLLSTDWCNGGWGRCAVGLCARVGRGSKCGGDEEANAGEVREVYEEVDSDVGPGADVEVVQVLDVEEDEEEICHFYEGVGSDVVSGSDAEGRIFCLEEMFDSASDSETTSKNMSDFASDSESTSGYWRFVRALFAHRFQCALVAFEPEFAGMRMVPNEREQHRKHDRTLPLPLHWLLNCDFSPAQRVIWLKLIYPVSSACA